MPAAPLPANPRIRYVRDFAELLATPFADGVNALCWPRTLPPGLDEIIARIGPLDEIVTLEEDDLLSLDLSPAARPARDFLLNDLRLLRHAGLAPSLDCIPAYPRDPDHDPVPTDVYSWHADSANTLADTWLCSYTESCSEGLDNDHALRHADVPALRAELLRRHAGPDDSSFRAYLAENFHDLHYAATPDARPWSFGLGHLWRIATDCPGSPVPPCIHRAPATIPGRPPRLLLIS